VPPNRAGSNRGRWSAPPPPPNLRNGSGPNVHLSVVDNLGIATLVFVAQKAGNCSNAGGRFLEAALWRLKQYWGWIAAVVGAILAWFAGFELLTKFFTSQTAISIAANVYVVVFSIVVVGVSAWRQWITMRKERYANITPILHRFCHEIRDLHTYILLQEPNGKSVEEYKEFLDHCKIIFGRVLDQLNGIFISITSTHCRSTLKLLYGTEVVCVYTLARDQISKEKCWRMDNERVAKNHDPLEGNHHLARLVDPKQEAWHFFCNNLMREKDFTSTSFSAYDPKHPGIYHSGKWVLPYRSTIVCAVRQGPFDLCQRQPSEVLGFLSVDSESRGVFEERWDIEIVFAVADALYHSVRAYIEAQNRAQAAGKMPQMELSRP